MYVTAPITNISRGSLHDGPGIRTVVYFKGCGLKCKWCHNPETLKAKKQILYMPQKCIHCGKCIEVCPECHKIDGDDMVFLREKCVSCGKCADSCPSLALTLCGDDKTSDELFSEIIKDKHYFDSSNGGVTFSGGECLLHTDFLVEILKKCKENGIHTAIESAFYVPWENVKKVIPYIDFVFADLKIPNGEKHKEFTGKDNSLIIENIKKLSFIHNDITIRIPVIPGVNDSEADFDGFSKILKTFGEGIKGVELLKYNNLAESKYQISGENYTKFSERPQTEEEMKMLCEKLSEKSGLNCYFV